MHLHAHSRGPQGLQCAQSQGQGGGIRHHGISIRCQGRYSPAAFLQQLEHALNPQGPADGRRRLAADLLDQVVVAPAGAQGTLGAELVGDEFKDREVVIVQSTHQAVVERPGHAIGIQNRFERIKVGQRSGAQEVDKPRSTLDHRFHGRVFGVQNTQRITVQAALGVFVQRLSVLLKVSDQLGAMQGPLIGLAQAVDFQPPIGDPDFFPQRSSQQDQFGINFRTGKTQGLSADLVKLPVAPALRAFPAKHRPHVVKALAALVK